MLASTGGRLAYKAPYQAASDSRYANGYDDGGNAPNPMVNALRALAQPLLSGVR